MKALTIKDRVLSSGLALGLVFAAAIVGLFVVSKIVGATPAPKYFVCKYVGQPGVDETLQTGQNPISVSGNALPNGTDVGDSFADKQGRSYVVAQDTGQDEPECPVIENPPVDVCDNIDGDQATVPRGYTEKDGVCTKDPIDDPENPTDPTTPTETETQTTTYPTFQGK